MQQQASYQQLLDAHQACAGRSWCSSARAVPATSSLNCKLGGPSSSLLGSTNACPSGCCLQALQQQAVAGRGAGAQGAELARLEAELRTARDGLVEERARTASLQGEVRACLCLYCSSHLCCPVMLVASWGSEVHIIG